MMVPPYYELCDIYHHGFCHHDDRVEAAKRLAISTTTNFDLPDFLAAQRQAANHNAELRLREKAREEESFYRVYAPWRLQLNAAIDANTSDLRPVQRDYVSAAQRDQARLRAVDVV